MATAGFRRSGSQLSNNSGSVWSRAAEREWRVDGGARRQTASLKWKPAEPSDLTIFHRRSIKAVVAHLDAINVSVTLGCIYTVQAGVEASHCLGEQPRLTQDKVICYMLCATETDLALF